MKGTQGFHLLLSASVSELNLHARHQQFICYFYLDLE